jgi:hypothetical protein
MTGRCASGRQPVRCVFSMKDVTTDNSGFLIAYLLPGFTALWGMSYLWEPIRVWLGTTPANAPTVGGFLYVTLASVAAGLTVSTVRWFVIDTLHHWTGLRQPKWDFSKLQANVTAYNVINEIHYKHYQHNANMLIAILFVYLSRRVHGGFLTEPFGWLDLGCLSLATLLFFASRDNLSKYYSRTAQFLNDPTVEAAREHPTMTESGGSPDQLSEHRLQPTGVH